MPDFFWWNNFTYKSLLYALQYFSLSLHIFLSYTQSTFSEKVKHTKKNIHETSGILWEKNNIILLEELCFYSNQDSIVLIYDFSTLLITKTVFQNIFSSLLHSEQHLLKLWPNTTNWCLIVIKILHTQTNNSSLVYIKHTRYL